MNERTPLTPDEKKRLKKLINNVKILSRKAVLSHTGSFIMRHQMRAVLKLMGVKDPLKGLVNDSIGIIKDYWPFKQWRLRKLIRTYGREWFKNRC